MDLEDIKRFLTDFEITSPKFAYGTKEFNGKVLYGGPYFDQNELSAAIDCLINGKWSVSGEKVYQFERAFTKYIGQKESVMVNSGSSANLLMIAAAKKRFGWKDGDGIIVSPVGFPTTISAITANNLQPIFIDIEWDTLNFDVSQISSRLEQLRGILGVTVRAIFVSPVLGNPPDIYSLGSIALNKDITLLLDGCDSLGTKWSGRHLSDFFTATTCSFYPAHHITTLQGGMISSNDEELIKIARSMSAWGRACYCIGASNMIPNGVCGRRFSDWIDCGCEIDHKYVYNNTGYNLQPLDLQGAIGLEQLKKIEEIHKKRKAAFRIINKAFICSAGTTEIEQYDNANISWFGVPVICKDFEQKKKLVAHLETNGIQTRNYFAGNILLHPAYKHLAAAESFPNANEVLKKVFFVGCAPFYTEEHFNHIEKTLHGFSRA